jgi:hypothetical protein
LGRCVKQLVCNPKIKGLKTLSKSNQPPAKTHKNNPTTKRHNPQMKLCPKTTKMQENGVVGSFGFVGEMGEEGGAVEVSGGSEVPG